MATIEQLKEFGVDVDEGLKRCMNNEALFIRLISTIPTETNFDTLKNAVESQDLNKAFEAAHALKGVLGNLSITPLFKAASELTEYLRGDVDERYRESFDELMKLKDDFALLF